MTKLPDGVREGEVLAGKYRVEAVVGTGGMGVVVAARHLLLGQRIAIKFMLADSWEHADAVARFVQEARSAIRIHSEHVARVLDVAVLESGVPYIVMEYLEGCDLAAAIARNGPLPVRVAVDYVLEACEAVAEAHCIGIVHRDLKPANLFLSQTAETGSRIKVFDFGISKNVRLAAETLDPAEAPPATTSTQPRAVLGSPFHMSPEQMESTRDVDSRTDIWALGVSLFELVTGKLPFTGSTLVQVYTTIMSDAAPAWKERLATVSPDLEFAIGKCLARNPGNRFQTVAELARALAPFGSERATESARRITRTIDRAVIENSDTPATRRSTSERQPRDADDTPSGAGLPGRSPQRRRLWIVGALVATGAGGIGIGEGMRRPPADSEGTHASLSAQEAVSPTVTAGTIRSSATGDPARQSGRTLSTPSVPPSVLTGVAPSAGPTRKSLVGASGKSSSAAPSDLIAGDVAPRQMSVDASAPLIAEPQTPARFDVQKMLESRK